MSSPLAGRKIRISIRFLDDRFHGRTDNDLSAEWPPSPMRLFQALIAGNKDRWNEAISQAFEWLEKLDPPVIIAPPGISGRAFTSYVPNNHRDANDDPAKRRVGKVVRPTLLVPGPSLPKVDYLWTLSNDIWPACETHARQIISAAKHIRAVGWGIDLAIGSADIIEGVPPPPKPSQLWKPTAVLHSAAKKLRTPTSGSLADAEDVHREFTNQLAETGALALARRISVFNTTTYTTASDLPPRPFAVFSLRDGDDERVSFRPSCIKHVVAMIRHQINEVSQHAVRDGRMDAETHERVVMGHGKTHSSQRLTISVLPSIGHQHVDGNISRVMIAESPGGSGKLIEYLADALVSRQLIPEGPDRSDRLAFLSRGGKDGVAVRFTTRHSNVWASVTPVILPGFDDRRRRKLLSLLDDSITQAGIPREAISSIEPSSVPFWAGALHAREYDPPAYLQKYPRYHIRIVFRHPVVGPITMGGGRYCGFGILAAMDGSSSGS
jgi:CRISPR-associated protein Csb2